MEWPAHSRSWGLAATHQSTPCSTVEVLLGGIRGVQERVEEVGVLMADCLRTQGTHPLY